MDLNHRSIAALRLMNKEQQKRNNTPGGTESDATKRYINDMVDTFGKWDAIDLTILMADIFKCYHMKNPMAAELTLYSILANS
jgi:hypothetical protein